LKEYNRRDGFGQKRRERDRKKRKRGKGMGSHLPLLGVRGKKRWCSSCAGKETVWLGEQDWTGRDRTG
jgi:hypothetical protein